MIFDKDVLSIKETDTLWKFYQKSFTLDGQKVSPPKNLCQYFWTAVMGFGFWITREIELWKLLAVFLGSIFSVFVISSVLTDAFLKIHPYIWDFVFWISIGPLVISMLALALALSSRIRRLIHNSPALQGYMAIIFGIGMVVFMVISWLRSSNFSLVTAFEDVLKLAVLGIAVMVVVSAVVGGLLYIWLKIPGEKKSNFAKLVKTFFEALKAKKRKFCPLVEPPVEFQKGKQN